MKAWYIRLALFNLLIALAACGGPRYIHLSEDAGRLWGGVTFAPDGASFLIVKDQFFELRTWPEGELRWRLVGQGYDNWGPAAVAFAPDSAEVAVGQDDRILFYATAGGSPAGEIALGDDTGYVPYLAYRPDGTLALLVGRGEYGSTMSLEVWNRQGEQVGEPVQLSACTTDWRQWRPFTPDGSRVAYVSKAPHVLDIVDVAEREQWEWDLAEPLHFDDYPNKLLIYAMAISPDGREIAIGLIQKYQSTLLDVPLVMRVDADTGQVIAALPAPVNAGDLYKVQSMAYSPDGQSLAVNLNVDLPHTVLFLYNLGEAEPRVLCNSDKGCCSRYPAFSPDGTTLATVCEQRVALWEVEP